MGMLIFEVVGVSDLHLGLLHRSSERIVEYRRMHLVNGYWDRMDYVASYAQSYCSERLDGASPLESSPHRPFGRSCPYLCADSSIMHLT